MRALRPVSGSFVPLFERLHDDAPGVESEPVPVRVLDEEGLAGSIVEHVRVLLNTRCPLAEAEVDYAHRSVIDFGLVDLSHYFSENPEDRRRIAMHVAKTIACYEPRLTKISVTIDGIVREKGVLNVTVDGNMRVGPNLVPVSFPISVDGSVGD